MLTASLLHAKALSGLHGKHYKDFALEGFGRLPRFWGQEVVFTPEARRWLARLQAEGYDFHQPTIGVWDYFHGQDDSITYENLHNISVARVNEELRQKLATQDSATEVGVHGQRVLQLAVGKPPFGVSTVGELNFMLNEKYYRGRDDDIMQAVRGSSPDLLNISVGIEGVPDLRHVISTHTIIVKSAGNDPLVHHDSISIGRRIPILVGASNARGKISNYSTYTAADIFAPGEHLFSNGEVQKGTSFAAPMVTGALADMFAILPPTAIASSKDRGFSASYVGEIFVQQRLRALIIHMLQKTSTPTAVANVDSDSGALNHYKLLRVAHRIAKQAENSELSVAELIKVPHIYNFSAEARQLYNEAMHLRTSTASQQDVLFKLREAVALDADNHVARHELANLYAQAGYPSLREFYAPPVLQQKLPHKKTAIDLHNLHNFKFNLLDLYTRELNTPELVRKHLDRDLLLAMIWAESGYVNLNEYVNVSAEILTRNRIFGHMFFNNTKVANLPSISADNPWATFDYVNPFPFIINYSKDVQRTKQLIDMVVEHFAIDETKTTLTLPMHRNDKTEEIIEPHLLDIDTDYAFMQVKEAAKQRLLDIDVTFLQEDPPFYISEEERVARQLPEFAGQRLNLVEWSILHDSRKLLENKILTSLSDLINDDVIEGYRTLEEMQEAGKLSKEKLTEAEKVAAELKGHILFTVKHTDNHVALGKLLDLHQQISHAAEHQALLQSLTNKDLIPKLQQILLLRLEFVR